MDELINTLILLFPEHVLPELGSYLLLSPSILPITSLTKIRRHSRRRLLKRRVVLRRSSRHASGLILNGGYKTLKQKSPRARKQRKLTSLISSLNLRSMSFKKVKYISRNTMILDVARSSLPATLFATTMPLKSLLRFTRN
jgi:hypothetical protein